MSLELSQDRFTTVKGVRTRYWAEGRRGSPIVLIHGLGGFIENWIYNVKPLAAYHRVYALDLIGCGQTDKVPIIHDLYILVDFIHDFMMDQHLEKAHLIGNSLGGGLALQFALKYPANTDKLVLVDNAGLGREVCYNFKSCGLPLLETLLELPTTKNIAKIVELMVFDASIIPQEFRDLISKYGNSEGALKALAATIAAGIDLTGQKKKLTEPLREQLKDVKAPALIVWGRQDIIIPVSHAMVAIENIPYTRLEIFDNCGHMPMLEYPDKFNRLVLSFLVDKAPVFSIHEKRKPRIKTR